MKSAKCKTQSSTDGDKEHFEVKRAYLHSPFIFLHFSILPLLNMKLFNGVNTLHFAINRSKSTRF